MNTANLKKYGPEARRDFIEAVRSRAAYYGLSANEVLPLKVDGEAAIIGDRHFPASIAGKRRQLEQRIEAEGFDHVIDAVAYTWFNRLVAIRYMELHDYLDHGYRVLSHPEGDASPEILAHAEHLDLPGLGNDTVVNLKLAGDKDSELYRLVLIAQCNVLSKAMPFLFERVDDESELLLPENLLKSDSVVRKLVNEVPEEEWQDIEVIGWLYQFYISEKKDQVIGKVVKSEDIPAATQLFTPNWIVKYMVQNSLGAQWLATYPDSKLEEQMEYYIEPAEQTDEVNAQLAAITPSSLNPEELTLIDPACGSGHILVEAYDLFKAIYLERGYRQKDVPKLILEKNLFGLDIDQRAAQLSGFALMMKGRADDRQLFEREVKLNIMALVNSAEFDAGAMAKGVKLADYELQPEDLTELKQLFEHATTFGSLIHVPERLASSLPALTQLTETVGQDLFVSEGLKRLRPLLRQAKLLAAEYDAVVANPPYMGAKYMAPLIKKFAKDYFPDSKADLFAVSAERFLGLAKPMGTLGLMTPFTWMFLRTYEEFRSRLVEEKTFRSLVQPEYHAFFDSAYVPVSTFVVHNHHVADFQATFIDLGDFVGVELQPEKTLEAIREPDCGWLYKARPDDFRRIPASRIVYWASEEFRTLFDGATSLGTRALKGLDTGGNIDAFLRRWSEVSADDITCLGLHGVRWFPLAKGGSYRRWYGNHEFVINYQEKGRDLRANKANLRSEHKYLRPGLTWTVVTVADFAVRQLPPGFLFDQAGSSIFEADQDTFTLNELAATLNSKVTTTVAQMLSPTISATTGDVREYPVLRQQAAGKTAQELIEIVKCDWDAYEHSWDFQSLPFLTSASDTTSTIESSYASWVSQNRDTIAKVKRLEEENNRLFIDSYGLAKELSAELLIDQITLTVNPAYRYGGKLTEEEQWSRFRKDTTEELISYSIGCMMGRYSLDEPGLIYAHTGNVGFDQRKYRTFPADDDGIIPLTDAEWFEDDATHRLEEFLSVAWDKTYLEENLTFLAKNLGPKKGESSRATIRRYMSQSFFKDHVQTYKKRPIYWLFSSGKNKALECLVYLHRYNEGTLSRMRTEYVIPLQGKIASRISQLADDIAASTSTSHRKQLQARHDVLVKQREELRVFDEKLRHYADQRIHLDLDDGVKVNYGKFGDLLANVKDITGKNPVKA